MKFRNLDENHDWTFGRGLSNYTDRNNAIKLNIKTRLLSWLNDCFFAQDEGIDWYNRLGKKGQRALLEADIKKTIIESEDVTAVIKISTSLDDRDWETAVV